MTTRGSLYARRGPGLAKPQRRNGTLAVLISIIWSVGPLRHSSLDDVHALHFGSPIIKTMMTERTNVRSWLVDSRRERRDFQSPLLRHSGTAFVRIDAAPYCRQLHASSPKPQMTGTQSITSNRADAL